MRMATNLAQTGGGDLRGEDEVRFWHGGQGHRYGRLAFRAKATAQASFNAEIPAEVA